MEELRGIASKALTNVDELSNKNKYLFENKDNLESIVKDTQDKLEKQKNIYDKLLITHFITKFELDRQFVKQHGDTNKYHALQNNILSPDKTKGPMSRSTRPQYGERTLLSGLFTGEKDVSKKPESLFRSEIREPETKKDEISALSFSQQYGQKNESSQKRIAELLSGLSPVNKLGNRRERRDKR